MFSPRCQLTALREDVHFCPAQHQSSAHCVPDAGQSTAHGNIHVRPSPGPEAHSTGGAPVAPAYLLSGLSLAFFSVPLPKLPGSPSRTSLGAGTAEGHDGCQKDEEGHTSSDGHPDDNGHRHSLCGREAGGLTGEPGQSALPQGTPPSSLGSAPAQLWAPARLGKAAGAWAGAGRGHGGQLGWGQGSRGGGRGTEKDGER